MLIAYVAILCTKADVILFTKFWTNICSYVRMCSCLYGIQDTSHHSVSMYVATLLSVWLLSVDTSTTTLSFLLV